MVYSYKEPLVTDETTLSLTNESFNINTSHSDLIIQIFLKFTSYLNWLQTRSSLMG